MAGRKPTPTHIKLVRGNPGKRPLNAAEPKPTRGTPRCPSHYTPAERKVWRELGKRLDAMGVLTVADGMALELLVGAYFEWRDARALIRDAAELQVVEGQQVETKDGLVYRSFTENGVILRTHPANSIASDAWRRIGSMLREFGLTPSSRTKVSTTASPADENPWAALVGQGAG